MGTAETPAEPIRGLTLPLVTRYMSLPRSTPPAVEKQNAVRQMCIRDSPKAFGKALIFVALGESIALYGVVISILILNKV